MGKKLGVTLIVSVGCAILLIGAVTYYFSGRGVSTNQKVEYERSEYFSESSTLSHRNIEHGVGSIEADILYAGNPSTRQNENIKSTSTAPSVEDSLSTQKITEHGSKSIPTVLLNGRDPSSSRNKNNENKSTDVSLEESKSELPNNLQINLNRFEFDSNADDWFSSNSDYVQPDERQEKVDASDTIQKFVFGFSAGHNVYRGKNWCRDAFCRENEYCHNGRCLKRTRNWNRLWENAEEKLTKLAN